MTGATVATGDGSEPIRNATVVVQGGRVVAAGAGVAVPAGMTVVDGSGLWVTPGLFASITNLGLVDVEAVGPSNDAEAEDSPFHAALDVAPAINRQAQDFGYSRAGGVTRATVTPSAGSGIFAGQGAVIDLGADFDAVREARAFQHVQMGEAGARLAGGSRTAVHTLIRNALFEATRLAETGERDDDAMLTRFDALALAPVVRGEQKLYVSVHRAADILSVLALREEFPALDLVLVGVTEGWMVAPQIAAADVPVITNALIDLPSSFERLAATQSNVGRMVDAGVRVAIGGYESSGDHPRGLPQQAGNMVALNRVPGATGLELGGGLCGDHFGSCEHCRDGWHGRRAARRGAWRSGAVGRRSARTVERAACGCLSTGSNSRSTTTRPGCAPAIARSTKASCLLPIGAEGR